MTSLWLNIYEEKLTRKKFSPTTWIELGSPGLTWNHNPPRWNFKTFGNPGSLTLKYEAQTALFKDPVRTAQ
jgi:hypothetical protein